MTSPVTTGPATEKLQERYAAAIMGTYGMPPVALDHGRGCVVWDVDGAQYLDLIGCGQRRRPQHAADFDRVRVTHIRRSGGRDIVNERRSRRHRFAQPGGRRAARCGRL